MEKTCVELFAGVGGFRCGLNKVSFENNKVKENGNWKFLWANQWEPSTKSQDAYDCYGIRFGFDNVSNIDIFEVDKHDIPDHTLLVGGFPCQDYSVAKTLSESKGLKGEKGILWWAIVDTIKVKKPPFIFLENVDRLLISPANQRGRDFGIILRSLYDNGYATEWRVINAGEYGEPQKRRRTYIIAYHKSTKYYEQMKKLDMKDIVVKSGIFAKQFPVKKTTLKFSTVDISKSTYKNLVDVSNNFQTRFHNSGVMCNGKIYTAKIETDYNEIYPLKKIRETQEVEEKYFLSDEKIEKFKFLKGSKRIPRTKPNGNFYIYSEGSMPFPDNLNIPARTILTSESGLNRMSHVIEDNKTKKLRLLTPVECERINGFPDNWTNTGMTDKKRYYMMGNALVVNIITRIGIELEKIIDNEN